MVIAIPAAIAVSLIDWRRAAPGAAVQRVSAATIREGAHPARTGADTELGRAPPARMRGTTPLVRGGPRCPFTSC